MALYQIAKYRIRPQAAGTVRKAVEEFVQYVKAHEPGTRMYMAWREKENPAAFVHFFIFEDEAAHRKHGESAAVKKFEAVYRPELDAGPVVFTDYELVATNAE